MEVAGEFRSLVEVLLAQQGDERRVLKQRVDPAQQRHEATLFRLRLADVGRFHPSRLGDVVLQLADRVVACRATTFLACLARAVMIRRAWPKLLVVTTPSSNASIKMFWICESSVVATWIANLIGKMPVSTPWIRRSSPCSTSRMYSRMYFSVLQATLAMSCVFPAFVVQPFQFASEIHAAGFRPSDVLDQRLQQRLFASAGDDLGQNLVSAELFVGQQPSLAADQFVHARLSRETCR